MEPDAADSRRSRITSGTFCAFGDLHNHSVLSDGSGDPERAFASMRAAGLDVAALTDHASIPHAHLPSLHQDDYPDKRALATARMAPSSIDDRGWRRTRELADAADVPGEFVALRGFEWTEPWLGHSNVWFSDGLRHVDTPGRMDGLHTWLTDHEPHALFGYNHPGREPGRFGDFALAPGLVPRMVSLEAFNRFDDYLFEGRSDGWPSPLLSALAAGWRPGLVGVSDEHGRSYGLPGKGRTGLWLTELTRAGVRQALVERRVFATREVGLRVDATLDGVAMGAEVAPLGGRHELRVDISGAYDGRRVELALLGHSDDGLPAVLDMTSSQGHDVLVTKMELPTAQPWVVLRVGDPTRRNGTPGPARHAANSYALAYASPWYAAQAGSLF